MEGAAAAVLGRQVATAGRVALRVVAVARGAPAELASLAPQRANAENHKDYREDNAPGTWKPRARHKGATKTEERKRKNKTKIPRTLRFTRNAVLTRNTSGSRGTD